MEIKWTNIICLGLTIFAVILLVRMHEQVGSFLGMIRKIGAGNDPEDQVMGLIAFGLVGVVLLGIIKIASRNNRNDS